MRWPLRYQILLPFTLVLLGTIVAVSIFNAYLAASRAHRQVEDQLRGIAATLADSTSNFPLNDWVLRQVRGFSGAEFVYTDLDGHVLAASSAIRLPDGDTSAVVENTRQLLLGSPIEIGNRRFFAMTLAMKGRAAQLPGRLHILYPEGVWREARIDAIYPPLAIGGIAMAATALVALLISKRLTRPIIELRTQVNRIAQADYEPMPPPRRNDEIRALAADVNRMAEQLAEMEKAIRRSERMALLGQLAGGLAHHLRNNVTGALMAVQLHARNCEVDRESLEVAQRQLALTEENLKQFLAASQVNARTLPEAPRMPCNMREIMQEVIELVGPSLRHRRVELTIVDRCKSQPHAEVLADRGQLRQIAMNLVLNAADAAGPGGKVRLETSSTAAESAPGLSVTFRVVDNGPGPPREMVDRLFEPFATGKPEGIGLGLAVAQQIAQSHGGRIVFERTGGETCFEVRLPALYSTAIGNAKPQAIGSTAS